MAASTKSNSSGPIAIGASANLNSNITLVIGLVVILATLLVRMPTPILDMLLAVSISLSIAVLIITISSKESLELSTFPSLLLFTTLFRLSLNVASTRLILLQGDAGKIIQTFGEFVAGGSFVVGIVIFLILVIIQFIVVTKGAERISEVAARFTLDAMPGKQMAIDADLNAGPLPKFRPTRTKRQNCQGKRIFRFYGRCQQIHSRRRESGYSNHRHKHHRRHSDGLLPRDDRRRCC